MLCQAFLLGLLMLYPAQGDLFQDLGFFHNFESQFQPHAWDQPRFEERSIAADSLVKDREPLSPEYRDPTPASSEDKPIVIEPTKENHDKPVLNPKKENQGPKHPQSPILPGGIVDLDVNGGFPLIPHVFGPEIAFPQLPELDKPGVKLIDRFDEIFGFTPRRKWWKGKNVCIEREESSDDEDDEIPESQEKKEKAKDLEPINFFSTSVSLSNCSETENKYECTTKINIHGMVKTFTVRYKCCYGFQKTPQSNGCDTQVDLKPVLQILDDLKLVEFKGLVKSSGLEDTFTNGNYTLFVPSDDAINDYNDKINDMNKVEIARRRRASTPLSGKEFVMSHATNGFYEIGDLQNEQKLQSEDNKKSPIRINMYPTQTGEKMLTANCARIKKSNILGENGVVYVLDKVINPAGDSIENIVDNHPKLTTFKRVVEKTDIPSHFKPDGHYTIFAPTDEAFNKLDEIQRQKLLSGSGCASSILKHHIVAHTVCSSAIVGNATTHNVQGINLNMERTLDDELIFEGKAKIVDTDIIGSNGIIHLIDTLIIPESGQYIGSVLKAHHFDKFQEIVDKAGLFDELNNFENATVFVPSNEAFDNLHAQKYLEQIGDDKEKLKELIRYHIIEGEMQSSDMTNNMLIASKDAGKELRVNLYSTLPLFSNVINRATVNCARLVGFDEKSCGSIVHEVNRVLVPPTKTLFDLINDDDRYTTLKQMLKGTEVEKILQDKTKSITFLAPTDETFATLEDAERKALLDSKEKAEEVLKTHILTEVLCCSGVGPRTWGFNSYVPTLGSQRVEVSRSGSQVKVNRAVVTSCDNLATNGVLHTINKVLAPKKPAVATIGGGFFLFDL